MGAHIQTVHEQKKPHVCPQCSKPFGLRQVLKKHIMSVHKGIKKFKCELCEYASIDKSHLKQHVGLVHEKIKHEKCPHCPKLCTTKGNLSQHISSVHTAEKLHRCEICDVSFKEARSLRRHEMESKRHLEIAASKLIPQKPVEEAVEQELICDGQFVNGNGNDTDETNLNVLYVTIPQGYSITPVVELNIEEVVVQAGVAFDFN